MPGIPVSVRGPGGGVAVGRSTKKQFNIIHMFNVCNDVLYLVNKLFCFALKKYFDALALQRTTGIMLVLLYQCRVTSNVYKCNIISTVCLSWQSRYGGYTGTPGTGSTEYSGEYRS